MWACAIFLKHSENAIRSYLANLRVTSPLTVLRNSWLIIIKPRLNQIRGAFRPGDRHNLRRKDTSDEKINLTRESSKPAKDLLIIDILRKMSERQSLITEALSKRIIRTDLLINIQKELTKDWKLRAVSSRSPTPQDEISRTTLDTIRKINLYDNTFKEEDLKFMLRIGWKLAQYHLGLTQELGIDEQYKPLKIELVGQMDSFSNPIINNNLEACLNFLFAVNSAYLFSSYLLANTKMKKTIHSNLYPAEIKEIRDHGLNLLLTYNKEVIEEVSKQTG